MRTHYRWFVALQNRAVTSEQIQERKTRTPEHTSPDHTRARAVSSNTSSAGSCETKAKVLATALHDAVPNSERVQS